MNGNSKIENLFERCRAFEEKAGLIPLSMAGLVQNSGQLAPEHFEENMRGLVLLRQALQQELNDRIDQANRLLRELETAVGAKPESSGVIT